MSKVSRRNILKSGAMIAAGTTAGIGAGINNASAADRAGTKYSWGHSMDFGEQYYSRMLEIIQNIRRNEMGLIAELSTRMADSIKNGGNVFMKAQAGHMGYHEF